jgi:ornithine cyclodeaminase/alanine dehydrogenase-like protein (mu-crystallin family)
MDAINKQAHIPIMGADATRHALQFGRLIPALRSAFASGANVPLRHHHFIPQPDGTKAVFLLMPAWQEPGRGYLGVKIVSIFPGNTARGIPGLNSTYLLCDGATGKPLALIDGNEITVRRTVGVAALAASYLARDDAKSLLIVGAGRVASVAAFAFKEVRPIANISIWDIDHKKAEDLAHALCAQGLDAAASADLEAAARTADIISCATLSDTPLIKAEWLKPGSHLDLIGSFTPQMREADDQCFAKGRIFLDSTDALQESGDLIDPIKNGVITSADVVGTLSDLCSEKMGGRRNRDEVTVFKAVGTALSDLAAGALVYQEF